MAEPGIEEHNPVAPDQWQKVKEIFSQASGLAQAAERRAYLDQACRDSPEIQREVESLLAQPEAPVFSQLGASFTGQTLSRYQVLERLGDGGRGLVYKGRDLRLKRFVALKVLPPVLAADAQARRRFFQEAECLLNLNHPNIVTIYDIDHDRDIDFIVMEYVEGQTLGETIPATGLSVELALEYARQIAAAMAKAHAAKVAHRDIKPSNILVTHDGFVKMLDFGLAKPLAEATIESIQTDSEGTRHGAILGTAGYMSPEQVRGEGADTRSDVFSFGVLLCEMLTGDSPFKRMSVVETMNAILRDEPAQLPRGVPRPVHTIVQRCLKKNPEARYQSADELRVCLGKSRVRRPRPKMRLPATGPLRERYRWAALAITLVVLLLAIRALPIRELMAKKVPVRTRVILAQLGREEGDTRLTREAVKSLQARASQYPDLEIRALPQELPVGEKAGVILEKGRQEHASLIFWVQGSGNVNSPTSAVEAAILDPGVVIPVRGRGSRTNSMATPATSSLTSAQITQKIWHLSLLALGVMRLNGHDDDGAIQAFNDALTVSNRDDPNLDPAVLRFYQALAYQARIAANHCQDRNPQGCDLKSAVSDLKQSVADLEQVIRLHPNHADSYWNEGLAYSGLCSLETRLGDAKQALFSGAEAIALFTDALQRRAPDEDFFQSAPDEGDILFNRGLTHLQLSRIGSDSRTQIEELGRAQGDFDLILSGTLQYARFLAVRRADVTRYRDVAAQERRTLVAKKHA